MPLLNHRLRKAAKAGAKVYVINPLDLEFNFDLAGKHIATPAAMVDCVLGLARAANDAGQLAGFFVTGEGADPGRRR